MSESKGTRIAVISAVGSAVGPAAAAVTAAVDGAEVWSITDDRLLSDARSEGMHAGLASRIARLVDYAIEGGADGVIVTCSLYAGAVVALERAVPVLPADEAGFEALAAAGHEHVLVVSPLPEALSDTLTRLGGFLPDHGARLSGAVVAGAHAAAGDADALGAAVLAAIIPLQPDVDAVFLAQYSLAPAAAAVAAATGLPVLTTPGEAARRLAERLHAGARA